MNEFKQRAEDGDWEPEYLTGTSRVAQGVFHGGTAS